MRRCPCSHLQQCPTPQLRVKSFTTRRRQRSGSLAIRKLPVDEFSSERRQDAVWTETLESAGHTLCEHGEARQHGEAECHHDACEVLSRPAHTRTVRLTFNLATRCRSWTCCLALALSHSLRPSPHRTPHPPPPPHPTPTAHTHSLMPDVRSPDS